MFGACSDRELRDAIIQRARDLAKEWGKDVVLETAGALGEVRLLLTPAGAVTASASAAAPASAPASAADSAPVAPAPVTALDLPEPRQAVPVEDTVFVDRSPRIELVVDVDGHKTVAALPAVLGRRPHRDGFTPVPIASPFREASRTHATVEFDGSGLVITDLHSRNGTYIGGRLLPSGGTQRLFDGQRVELGDVCMTLTTAPTGQRSAVS
ncbi:hypothetical protein A9Z40_02000 [Microbacterium arborescens]|uniref:FHA domain-containing protein n=1 Tax=Microbacterium arborescens TaxID=33883 RepID=A0ABX2WJJ2_9MICO|nr:hypothetical protein A9Z40_02000 [Microbacterium arborescens]